MSIRCVLRGPWSFFGSATSSCSPSWCSSKFLNQCWSIGYQGDKAKGSKQGEKGSEREGYCKSRCYRETVLRKWGVKEGGGGVAKCHGSSKLLVELQNVLYGKSTSSMALCFDPDRSSSVLAAFSMCFVVLRSQFLCFNARLLRCCPQCSIRCSIRGNAEPSCLVCFFVCEFSQFTSISSSYPTEFARCFDPSSPCDCSVKCVMLGASILLLDVIAWSMLLQCASLVFFGWCHRDVMSIGRIRSYLAMCHNLLYCYLFGKLTRDQSGKVHRESVVSSFLTLFFDFWIYEDLWLDDRSSCLESGWRSNWLISC